MAPCPSQSPINDPTSNLCFMPPVTSFNINYIMLQPCFKPIKQTTGFRPWDMLPYRCSLPSYYIPASFSFQRTHLVLHCVLLLTFPHTCLASSCFRVFAHIFIQPGFPSFSSLPGKIPSFFETCHLGSLYDPSTPLVKSYQLPFCSSIYLHFAVSSICVPISPPGL